MGFLQSYGTLLIGHPGKIIVTCVSVVITLFLVTLIVKPAPSFRDPLVGFEARDTPISNRINAWKVLLDETTTSVNLPPKRFHTQPPAINNGDSNTLEDVEEPDPPLIEMSKPDPSVLAASTNEAMDEDELEYYRSINSTLDKTPNLVHYGLDSSRSFCGKLYEGYAQVVVAPTTRQHSSGMFDLNSMISICALDRRLRLEQSSGDADLFKHECEQYVLENKRTRRKQYSCCNSWSVPNYIACLSSKSSCIDINNHDLRNFEYLINKCAPYYYAAPYEECFVNPTRDEVPANQASPPLPFSLTNDALSNPTKLYCGNIPEKCLRCEGWAYTVLNYLVDDEFIRVKSFNGTRPKYSAVRQERAKSSNSLLQSSIIGKLTLTNIFLPIAKSSSLLKYYQALTKHTFKTPFTQIRAMDLGLKNSLFEHLVSHDTKLFVIALASILVVISIYTWSLIISWIILMIICLSLCLSYTIYELVFDIPIFPFMNLLAVVISIGICSDNAMLFCKHWNLESNELEDPPNTNTNKQTNRERVNLDRTLSRAIVSTSVATLATACSFLISAISKVTAVRCFCIFATLSVLTNYLLIVLLLPSALLVDLRLREYISNVLQTKGQKVKKLMDFTQKCRQTLLKADVVIHRQFIFFIVTNLKTYLIITFSALLCCSMMIVFYAPTLKPSDDEKVQLLSRNHAFEQYDRNLSKQFAFERLKLGDAGFLNQNQDFVETLPVRVVFGIKPTDNGNHLDPQDRGSLELDPQFDFFDENTQIWLLNFCHLLGQQRFIHTPNTPDLSSCFLDTFKSWMDSRTCRDPVIPELDRSPCCQTYRFPYNSQTFNKCIGEATMVMRKTPQFHHSPHTGVRFSKNSSNIVAVILEYQSNRIYTESYTKMDSFYTLVEDWVSWHINNTAPPGLKSGWFTSSNSELYALQTELITSTMNSIMLEVLFATVALAIGTRDLVLTLVGTITIGTIILATVASLILLKWTLGVTESVLISLTIGLSIDFALHYSVAFQERKKNGTCHGVILGVLKEVGSPIALATVTTFIAGLVIVWSDILAYQELGQFLMLIGLISWTTSTFFLLPMLAHVDSVYLHEGLIIQFIAKQLSLNRWSISNNEIEG